MSAVYREAESSGLFAQGDIKVRLKAFKHFKLAEGKSSFLYVFAYIMEGRTDEQKAALSKAIIERLTALLNGVSFIAMNVTDFDKSSYCNKSIINPDNLTKDRHFDL